MGIAPSGRYDSPPRSVSGQIPCLGGGGQRTLCFRFKFEHGRYADGLRGPSSASFGRYEVGSAIAALRPRAHVRTWVKAGLRNGRGCSFAL